MRHFHQDVPGWFNFRDLYAEMCSRLPDGGTFVEVGCHLGCSAAFAIVELVNRNRPFRFCAVDNFCAEVRDGMLANLAPVSGRFTLLNMDSRDAAGLFGDGSVDCIFIDGDHNLDGVTGDLEAWWPKFRRDGNGIFAGHDYGVEWLPGVRAAVDRFFGKDVEEVPASPVMPGEKSLWIGDPVTPVRATCWRYRKRESSGD